MNILTILHTSFWGALGNLYSFKQFNIVLKYKQGENLNIKIYFKMTIHAYIIIPCIYCCYVKKFEDFDTFLVICNNWPMLLKEVEKST